jgi:hypothetical protein
LRWFVASVNYVVSHLHTLLCTPNSNNNGRL